MSCPCMQNFWDYSPSVLKIEKNDRNTGQLPHEKRLNQRVKTRNGNTRGHSSLKKRQLEEGILEVYHTLKGRKEVNRDYYSHFSYQKE